MNKFCSYALKISLALAGLTANIQAQAATCGNRPCIHVGAFNIKLLGNQGPADTPAEYKKIGDLLANTMDMDVISLEEINTGSPQWADLKAELQRRGYAVAFESAFGGERDQFIVLVYRSSSVQLVSPAPTDLPFATSYAEPGTKCNYPNIRPPVSARFRSGSFDFALIGVHLKSQLPVGSDQHCDDRIRAEQVKKITDHVAEFASQERDVIIVGDFNASFSSTENDAFRNAQMMSAMEDLSQGSGTISYAGSPKGMIDHIVFPASMQNYVRRSGRALPLLTPISRRSHLRQISDHVPIRAAFFSDYDGD